MKLLRSCVGVGLLLGLVRCGGVSASTDKDYTDDSGAARDGGAVGNPPAPDDAGASVPQKVSLDRAAYQDRLAAMWMAQSIANWTGLITEGRHNVPPYLTDDDWGRAYEHTRAGSAVNVLNFNIQDPWLSDDDTDIEYIHLAAMTKRGDPYLTGEDIRESWLEHTEPGEFIWVANLAAQSLMWPDLAVVPPSTSLLAANDQSLMIDAQLTTEFFGALAPGMPRRALALADLPIRTAASGYALHAAQFHVIIYSLAAVVDATLTPRERVLWLARTARKFVPDSSKTAAMFDFVLADYLANPEPSNWERTRDAVHAKFGPPDEGAPVDPTYRYLEWYESPVNFGTGIMALLYGEGDLKNTIRIGTLSGWDSDNGTATMGGLLGLMLGTEGVRAQFPDTTISPRYEMVSRVGFDPSEDTFEAMAARMVPLAERVVVDSGGTVGAAEWVVALEQLGAIDARKDNPTIVDFLRSANNTARNAGQAPAATLVATEVISTGDLSEYSPASSPDLGTVVDGLEFDASGSDRKLPARTVVTFPDAPMVPRHVALRPTSGAVTVEVTYPAVYAMSGVRFVEGPAWEGAPSGWQNVVVSVFHEGSWSAVPLAGTYDPRPQRAFDIHELTFAAATSGSAIRLEGAPLGAGGVVTLCEVEAILAP